MLVLDGFETRGVGREAGLYLLHRAEPQLLKEHRLELLRRIHLELVPGDLLDLSVERRRLLGELVVDGAQHPHVHADAARLHATEHRDEGQLHLFVDETQLPTIDVGAQHLAQSCAHLDVAHQGVVGGGLVEK